ncbi:MAG: glycerol-3-phosphate 1-O-acyltransferase PlsY [Coriobacteriia bacterium]|nr:glycerol-3-phosphate 1-O-acyltransferase PlsY [Coriobacteriia bacterium]
MEDALRLAGAAIGAYLVGSIPWAVIVVRIFWQQDIRSLGSGNTGATNVLRVFGTAPGVAVLMLDAGKGAAGVWLASLLAPVAWGADGLDWFRVIGATAAIAGHALSPFIGFKGGKGVATAAGAITMLAPKVMPILLVVFVAVVAVWKHVSLGSIVIASIFPGVCWWMYPDRHALLAYSILAAGLVIWRHRSNMGRIWRGEESKITFRRRVWDDIRSRDVDGGA